MLQNNTLEDKKLLAKAIRDSGLYSRKEARELIDGGQVKVNDSLVYSPCFKVGKEDLITVKDKKISGFLSELKIWLYHKPVGLVTTHKDPQSRKTVFDKLPQDLKKVISVGRLDLNSSGLLLLTNSGDFARFMELPKNNIKRIYKVRVFGKLDLQSLKKLEQGCVIAGIKYGKTEIKILRSSKNNHWVQITLSEGKNREIRKLFSHINLQVTKLIRIQYGFFKLGVLKAGEVKQVAAPKNFYRY